MEFWAMLGIGQTEDEEAIHAAYREKLQLVHPEDHPEEFMQLRQAYDQALAFARRKDEEAPHEATPVDRWIGRVKEVYSDFSRRIDVSEWKKLFEDELCQGLDSRLDVRNALLKYCMEDYLMPNDVWKLIVDTFSLKENYDELCELFPKAYIDNAVIGGVDYEPLVPYDLFAPGTTGNPDGFISLYRKARDERREGNLDSCAATVKDMENSGFEHPYIRLAQAELALAREENDRAVEIIDALAAEYPEDIGIRIFHGEVMRHVVRDFERGLADYEYVAEKKPRHNQAAWGKAECLLQLGKLEDAKDIYLHLHQRLPYDSNITERIEEINRRLVEEYEKKIADSPDDFELCMDFAWSCLQRKETDRAKELISGLQPADLARRSDLENFTTKLLLNCDDYEGALAHAIEWEKTVRELPEGETEKEKKRKGKLGEVLYLQSAALMAMERYDEALQKTFESEEAAPESTDALEVRRRVYHRTRRFDEAVEVAEKVTRMNPGYESWFALGYEQYCQGSKGAAFQSFGEALDYARVLQAYIFRCRILCDFEEWDALKENIDFLVESGIEEQSIHVRYLRARLDHKDGEKQKALDAYVSIIEEYEKAKEQESDSYICDYIWEVYHLAADIKDDFDHPYDDIMAYIARGLAEQEDYFPLLELKNYMLHKTRRHAEVIEHNRVILGFYPKARYCHERIGDAHYFLDNYAEAVEEYLIQEKVSDSVWVQEVLGLCLMYLERYEEAEAHYRKALELEPECIRPRANLGLMYERRYNKDKNAFDFELSLPLQQKCVELNDALPEEKRRKIYRTNLARCLCRLGRYEEAMAVYRRNLELYGEDEDARREVELYMESGRFAEGEKLLKKYYAQGRCKEPYYIMMADFARYRGKHREYLKLINKVEEEEKKLRRLAEYYAEHGDNALALQHYRRLDELDPNRVDALAEYISLVRAMGRSDECRTLAERAFANVAYMEKEGWNIALYLTKMAILHVASGNPEAAKPYIDRAMTAPMCDHCRYSRCKDAYIALAEYYCEIGEYQKAMDTCREGSKIAPDEYDFIKMINRLKKERKAK